MAREMAQRLKEIENDCDQAQALLQARKATAKELAMLAEMKERLRAELEREMGEYTGDHDA